MRWMIISSIELPLQKPVQLFLELEANLLDQNVNELEFELFRIYP